MKCSFIVSYNDYYDGVLARVHVKDDAVLTNEVLAKKAARYLPRKIRDFYSYAHVERMGEYADSH